MIQDTITELLKAEGWDRYTNHPADRGGPTRWGITQKAWGEALGRPATVNDVRAITEQQARDFYYERYVKAPRYDELPEDLMPLVVDCAVNHGTKRATQWLQRSVGVLADGVIGPVTLAAVRSQSARAVYLRICAHRTRFYGAVVGRDHSQAAFISGWNNRAAKWIAALAERER